MPTHDINLSCPLHDSFRVQQVLGMFDMPDRPTLAENFTVELPDEDEPWRIGVIVGPTGSGKTSVARKAYGRNVYAESSWPADRAVIDCLGDLPIREITRMLSLVGFSSPPSWIKPYAVLSNGEKFRCELARALLGEKESAECRVLSDCGSAEKKVLSAECGGERNSSRLSTSQESPRLSTQHSELSTPPVVIDEFTSLVDRTVAKISSTAISRHPKRKDQSSAGCRHLS